MLRSIAPSSWSAGDPRGHRHLLLPFSRMTTVRCPWAEPERQHEYHDTEWGVPSHDDRHLFEMLILEGAQAGLSWATILARRETYRAAYGRFDPAAVARYDARKQARLLADPGIIRNRLKVEASVLNARAFLAVQAEFGSFDRYLWNFVGGRPKVNRWTESSQVPTRTAESDALSADLKRRGFKFVGTTICYAFMQATGLVNDHLVSCPRHAACAQLR
jgi:DNA-3-methyladenine glycosylase I